MTSSATPPPGIRSVALATSRARAARRERAWQAAASGAAALAAFVVAIAAGWYLFVRERPPRPATGREAYVMACQVIREQLKSPASAEFPWYRPTFVTRTAKDRFEVDAYVDAENIFGASLRAYWSAELRHNRERDTWSVKRADLLE